MHGGRLQAIVTGGPWLALIVCFFLLPVAGLALISLTGADGSFPTVASYAAIFAAGSDRPAVLLRTLGMALAVVGASLVIAVPVAYHLAKGVRSARLQALVLSLVAVTFLVGPLVRTVSWRGILGRSGLVNTLAGAAGLIDQPISALLYGRPAVLVAMTYNAFPFMLFTVFLAMRMVDDRYIAAARDLGASSATAFWRVVMPLCAPGLWTGAILVFVPTLSTILEPEILGGTSGRLSATEIRDQFFHALNWPMGSALTVLLIIAGGASVAAVAFVIAGLARACGQLGIRIAGRGEARP
ncbi:ABC transporter permease [Pseudoxanthobacter sp.]|uniref:ABC transporter permease n=1 Tax=Pseudoxanthobacter sp. TaxID=1925742 RepID=UPI002FE0DB3D